MQTPHFLLLIQAFCNVTLLFKLAPKAIIAHLLSAIVQKTEGVYIVCLLCILLSLVTQGYEARKPVLTLLPELFPKHRTLSLPVMIVTNEKYTVSIFMFLIGSDS